jgi:glycosyltransferase involved in cell wall biosynthesis
VEFHDNPRRATPYLLFLKPGPSNSLTDIEPHATVLSRRFRGELWTHGCYEADRTIASFRLRVIQVKKEGSISAYLAFWKGVMGRAAQLRAEGHSRIVVIAYDPLKTGLLASRAAKLLRCPLVCEVNGTYGDPAIFSDTGTGFRRQLRLMQAKLLGRYVLRRADCVKLLFDRQLAGFGTPAKGALIRRFIDIAYIDRFYQGPEEPFVLMVGYPFKLKGTDILFRAFVSLADEFPQWKLVLIGHLLNEGMKREGLSHPRVTTLRGMPQPELAQWVSRCAIVAQPSRTEAMGRVLIEAAAAGKCRIASRVNGIPTVVNDGVDGMLVPKEDEQALADGLRKLMTDATLRRRLGDAARDRALREFSTETYLDHYEELLSAVVKREENS